MSSARWKEIADAIRAEIESGRLPIGDRLPSESELAARWGVCRMTAHRAMQELQRQGWVTGNAAGGPPPLGGGGMPRTPQALGLLFASCHPFA
jgi:DNA-binding FadR family transcriptional regulator